MTRATARAIMEDEGGAEAEGGSPVPAEAPAPAAPADAALPAVAPAFQQPPKTSGPATPPRDQRKAVKEWLAGDRGRGQFGVTPERWGTATAEEVEKADTLAA